MNTSAHRALILLVASVAFVVFGAKGVRAANPEVNVSGWEFFPGVPCNLGGSEPATCGATFGGWTGGDGDMAGGWTPFPGNRRGLW